MLEKFNISNSSLASLPIPPGYNPSPATEEEEIPEHLPYRNLLGCLHVVLGCLHVCIAHGRRPVMAWTVASLSQYAEKPTLVRYKALLRTLIYLASTLSLGVKLPCSDPPVQLAVDASWAIDTVDRKSWSGYTIFLNSIPVTWRVTKQTCIALSPMEAEFIAASETVKDLKFFQTSIQEIKNALILDDSIIQKPPIFCDTTAAIAFMKNKADNIRNRHVDLKYKFIRDWYQQVYSAFSK